MSESQVQHQPPTHERDLPGPAAPPWVLPYRPAQGWRRAGTLQRAAVGYPLLLVLWPACLQLFGDGSGPVLNPVFTALWALGAPPAYFAIARILRPYPPGGGGIERVLRHGAAALATSYATALLLGPGVIVQTGATFEFAPEEISGLFLVVPWLIGTLTVVWGAIAAIVRLARR